MKPVLLLDVDGVVLDLMKAFYHYSYGPGHVMLYDEWLDCFETYNVKAHLGDQAKANWDYCMRSNAFWERVCMYPMVQPQTMDKLCDHFEVVFVTKPSPASEWCHIRTKVLESLCPGASIIFTQDKWRVRGDVFIEDCKDNLDQWTMHNPRGVGLLYDWPWTEQCTDYQKFTWRHTNQLIQDYGSRLVQSFGHW